MEFWLAAVGVYALTQVVSALRWQQLSRPLGFSRALVHYIRFYYIGMFFNLVLPTSVGGDVVRAWYLQDGPGRRLSAFLSVFIDRFSGLLVLLCLACVAVPLCPIPLPGWIPASVLGTAGCAFVGLACVGLTLRITRRFQRLIRIQDSLRLLLANPRLLLSSTVLSLVVQAANVVVVWLVGQAISLPVPQGYYWIVVPMVSLLTLLPVSLSGIGVREFGMILFLQPLGIADGMAISLAFLWFLAFTATSLAGGFVYLLGQHARPEEQFHDGAFRADPDQGRAGQSRAAA